MEILADPEHTLCPLLEELEIFHRGGLSDADLRRVVEPRIGPSGSDTNTDSETVTAESSRVGRSVHLKRLNIRGCPGITMSTVARYEEFLEVEYQTGKSVAGQEEKGEYWLSAVNDTRD